MIYGINMQPVLKMTAVVLGIYLAYTTLLYLMQRQMMFPRHMAPTRQGAPAGAGGMERFWIEAGRARCEAWLVCPHPKHRGNPSPAVILAHGNAETIDFLVDEFEPFTRMGLALLLVEYPGYGRSTGTPSQQSITDVFLAAYDRLSARPDIDASRVVLVGRSLGGGAVCQLAARRPSAALILISSFTSAAAFAPRYLVPGFMVRDPFDNLAVVRGYDRPVLVFHGRGDTVIPFSHGQTLARNAADGRLVPYDCGHNDCPPDARDFWNRIASFLRASAVLADPALPHR
jgi:pimeloyl-ACP methyl ester carboxylesterase